MKHVFDYPIAVLVISLAAQWAAAFVGDFLRKRGKPVRGVEHADFEKIVAGALTLLALIIGFSFSMAVSRYDLRKTYEEAEANAIGTEYARAQLLPSAATEQIRDLLSKYADQRISFYRERDPERLKQIDADTARLQTTLWSAVAGPSKAQPTPVAALAVSGMNDVLNSQGFTQAAWWNRVPIGAWALMVLISIACNLLLAASERRAGFAILLVLPIIVSVSLFLIAEIDSPRSGVIQVVPQNLVAVSKSFTAP